MKNVILLLGFTIICFAGEAALVGVSPDQQKEVEAESAKLTANVAQEAVPIDESEEAGAYNFEFEEADAEEHAELEEEKKANSRAIDAAGDMFSAYYNLD